MNRAILLSASLLAAGILPTLVSVAQGQTGFNQTTALNSVGGGRGFGGGGASGGGFGLGGISVQVPVISVINVTTTVSVPDGGTVLLGGIMSLQEGRNEAGVPMLTKIPYINRMFRNVGVGREAQSLMMMVTPRLIIQEEEE